MINFKIEFENCVCETKPDDLSEMNPICKIYVQYNDYFVQCGHCGHLKDCHRVNIANK